MQYLYSINIIVSNINSNNYNKMLKFCLNPFRLIRVVILIEILIKLIRVLILINPDPGSN